MSLRVSLLGYGAIGQPVADALGAGDVPGVELAGVVTRTAGRATARGHRELSLDEALAASDLIVECAGINAGAAVGPRVIASGTDLLIVSVGVLADPDTRRALLHDGPGRCFLTAGAIGGLDLLGAVSATGGLASATLTTSKTASSLIQPWMNPATVARLTEGTDAATVFEGTVTEAIERFPSSLNVAVALAAATGLWEQTRVRLVADPRATMTTHHVEAHGSAGDYEFTIRNHPLESNPRTSGAVPAAVLRGIRALAQPSGIFL
jgi:aspartate dehydrogenase